MVAIPSGVGATLTSHRAIIESLDNSTQLIAAGPEEFCEDAMIQWKKGHTLDKYDKCLILLVVRVVI